MQRLLLVAALVSGWLLPSFASAQAQHVLFVELEGRGAAVAQRLIVEGLRERGLEVTETAPPDDLAAAAREAGAGAIVTGRVRSRRRQYQVTLQVRDATGGEQGGVRMRVRGAGGVSRLVDRLAGELELVPTAASPSAEPLADPGSDEAREAPPPVSEARPTESPPPAAPTDAEAFPVQALFQVGAGLRSRSVELLSPDGVDAAYRVEPYFELTARAEARFFDVAFVRASFGSSVGLTSEREDPRLGQLDTWFVRFRGDAGASWWIEDQVELGAALGIGWDRYELAFNELLPTAEYLHLRPAIVSGFRLLGRLLVLDAELGARFPFGVGQLESVYGRDHDVWGVDGLMRLHGLVEPGFTWAAEVGFRHYELTFRRPDGAVTGHDAGWHATAWVGWQI